MTDPTHVSIATSHPARDRLLELKGRFAELELEALRRGYGLDPASDTSPDDLDTIIDEVTASVEQRRAIRARLRPSQRSDERPPAGRV